MGGGRVSSDCFPASAVEAAFEDGDPASALVGVDAGFAGTEADAFTSASSPDDFPTLAVKAEFEDGDPASALAGVGGGFADADALIGAFVGRRVRRCVHRRGIFAHVFYRALEDASRVLPRRVGPRCHHEQL